MKNSSIRTEVIDLVRQELSKRLELLLHQADQLNESLHSEQKGSAGDKHETSRSMVQLELEKLGKQILECENNLQLLSKISAFHAKPTIQSGSIIQTTSGIFFIGIGLGSLRFKEETIYVISSQAPVAKLIIGLKSGDTFHWNNDVITVQEIL